MWKVVAVAHGGGRDQKVPEDVSESEAAFLHGVLVVVEGIPLVLHEVHEPRGPAEEPEEVREELEL